MNAIDVTQFENRSSIKVVVNDHFDERLGKWFELVIFGVGGGIIIANLINCPSDTWVVEGITEHGDKFNGITEFAENASYESAHALATSIVDYAAEKAA